VIQANLTYAMAAAFTIAADPDPETGLIDMLVLTGIGRMVYEDYWGARDEVAARPALETYRKLERYIQQISDPILTAEQTEEMRARLEAFHANNLELTAYGYLRAADLPLQRGESTLARKKSGGIFGSVRKVTDQVEQARLLAERAMYLGTRLPLTTGYFASMWASEVGVQPPVNRLLEDVHSFSDVADRLATVAEELPDKLARERHDTVVHVAEEAHRLRHDTVVQLLDGIAAERKNALEDLLSEEERIGGLLTELRETITETNTLVTSVQGLVDSFAEGEEVTEADAGAEPFDIGAYESALAEAGTTIRELNTLVVSTNTMTPRLAALVDDIIDRGFRAAALLIVLTLLGFVAAGLLYRVLARHVFGLVPR